jgi:hypothetical protein
VQRYGNLSGRSGVVSYEIGRGSIAVEFTDGWIYLYTARSAGTGDVAEMQRLARAGSGLSTYISRFVRERYERKYHRGD